MTVVPIRNVVHGFFGAVDPNSGRAALLDIAQRFGKLRKQGWWRRRTIILCSWDTEEYGSIGSTERVEQNLNLLHSRTVLYINVECAVAGPGFYAFATPQLDKLVEDVTRKVYLLNILFWNLLKEVKIVARVEYIVFSTTECPLWLGARPWRCIEDSLSSMGFIKCAIWVKGK